MKHLYPVTRKANTNNETEYYTNDGGFIGTVGDTVDVPDSIDTALIINIVKAANSMNDLGAELFGILVSSAVNYESRIHTKYFEYREAQADYVAARVKLDYAFLWANGYCVPVAWDTSNVDADNFDRTSVVLTIRDAVEHEPLVIMREDAVAGTPFGTIYESPIKAMTSFFGVTVEQRAAVKIEGRYLVTPHSRRYGEDVSPQHAATYEEQVGAKAITRLTRAAAIVWADGNMYGVDADDIELAASIINSIAVGKTIDAIVTITPVGNGLLLVSKKSRVGEVHCSTILGGAVNSVTSRHDENGPGSLLDRCL